MNSKQLNRMVLAALFTALIILFGLTPIGMIPLPSIKISLLGVPVIIGTMLLGLAWGEFFGLCFGLVSLYTAFTAPSGFVALLMPITPVGIVFMCIVPRLLIPLVAHCFYRLTTKNGTKKWAIAVSAAAGSLTNTIGYLGVMLALFLIHGLDSTAVVAIIGGTGLIAGGLEAATVAIIAVPVLNALQNLNKRKERI